MRLAIRQIQYHLCEETVRPRKPTSSIVPFVIDRLRLVNEAEARSILSRRSDHVPTFQKVRFMLTLAIRYKDVRISSSSSVPKMAAIWDIGLDTDIRFRPFRSWSDPVPRMPWIDVGPSIVRRSVGSVEILLFLP